MSTNKGFEPRLKFETSKYYSNLCKMKCEDELNIVEYLNFVKQSLDIESRICNEILVPISHYLLIDVIYNECIRSHYKTLLGQGLSELMREKKYSHIQLLYEFICNVNLLSEMYIAFNNAVYEAGSKIVDAYLLESYDDDWDMVDNSHTRQNLEEKINMFIPKLLEYREEVKVILAAITKASDNNEHSYAFK